MAILRNIILLIFIATASSVYADDSTDYRAQQEQANAQFQQSVSMQNMQNQINSQDAAPVYQQPQVEYQPIIRDTANGSMYVGPGSGFDR